MSYGVIYKITHKENKRIYIGATTNYLGRLNTHKKRFNPMIYTFEIIHECNSKEDLEESEKFWINYYSSIEKGYNKKQGGHIRNLKKSNLRHFLDTIKINTNTYYVTIPIEIIRGLKLEKDDFIELTINKIFKEVEA